MGMWGAATEPRSVAFLTAAAPVLPAPAQDADFWSFLETGQAIKRCAPMSSAHVSARADLQRFDDRAPSQVTI
jgi:hypothetical protein